MALLNHVRTKCSFISCRMPLTERKAERGRLVDMLFNKSANMATTCVVVHTTEAKIAKERRKKMEYYKAS